MAPIHRIAVVQWHIKVSRVDNPLLHNTPVNRQQALAVEENHQKACDYIRSAAAEGAKLVVLPEYYYLISKQTDKH